MRTIIIGGPRTGKTTQAQILGGLRNEAAHAKHGPDACRKVVRVRHTDDLIGALAWSEASRVIAEQWLTEPGPWIIEGVAAVRALRKWLLYAMPNEKPCDEVIVLTAPRVQLTSGQASMAKGHAKIWAGIERDLRYRGVVVEVRS